MESLKNFTNIDTLDFVGMFTGEEIPVKAGETRPFTETIAKHIADQLVTKILIREEKNYLTDPKREILLKEMLGEITIPQISVATPNVSEVPAEPEKTFEDLEKKKRGRPKK